MTRRRIRFALTGLAAAVAAAALPAGAGATAFTSPTSLNFGSQPVGLPGAPQTTTLLVQCTNYIGFPLDTCVTGALDPINVNITTPPDYSATSTCPATLGPGPLTTPNVCTISVTFKPTKAGTRTGKLSTGTTPFLTPGPTVDLIGAGFAIPGSQSGSGGATKKKCKKHKKAAARTAKKCKKK